jgi:hypothetical protein
MYVAGDVRVETVPDAHLVEPTDALVRVTRAAICGSDLWPYKSMEPTDSGRRMRAYIDELLPDVLEGRIEPGRVFDRTGTLDDVPDG